MEPLPDLSSLDQDQLQDLLKELHDKACRLFGEAFDAERAVKVRVETNTCNNFHPDILET